MEATCDAEGLEQPFPLKIVLNIYITESDMLLVMFSDLHDATPSAAESELRCRKFCTTFTCSNRT